ncbi:MAG: endo-1,4-beta-xylanase [Phycisphaerae bacterium]
MKFNNSVLKSISLLIAFSAVIWASGCDSSQPALKDAYKNDFLMGCAVNRFQVYGMSPKETAIVKQQFDSITPENDLKWEKLYDDVNGYHFEAADKFVEFGQKNNMFIVGHTLVWHYQTPMSIFVDADGNDVDRETLLKRMKDHIFTVVGRYKGRVNGWDVVNEALDANGVMRETKWMEIIGPDYIEKAFEYAHQADPDAELYYNDFDMWKSSKFQGVVQLVNNLKAKGLRIDAVGMQGHWGFNYPLADELEAAIQAYSQTGVKVMVTELDISVLPNLFEDEGADIAAMRDMREGYNLYPDGLPDEVAQKQAARYAELFSIFHKHAGKISRITFWGVQDGNSWRNNWPVRGCADYPLLFGRDYQPKPAFYAVMNVVKSENENKCCGSKKSNEQVKTVTKSKCGLYKCSGSSEN